jgi:hypothetical protein
LLSLHDVCLALAAGSGSRRRGHSRGKKAHFVEYWKFDELVRGLKAGQAFRSTFRVNASDRTQAFATVEGLPSDVFIKVAPRLPMPVGQRAARDCRVDELCAWLNTGRHRVSVTVSVAR